MAQAKGPRIGEAAREANKKRYLAEGKARAEKHDNRSKNKGKK